MKTPTHTSRASVIHTFVSPHPSRRARSRDVPRAIQFKRLFTSPLVVIAHHRPFHAIARIAHAPAFHPYPRSGRNAPFVRSRACSRDARVAVDGAKCRRGVATSARANGRNANRMSECPTMHPLSNTVGTRSTEYAMYVNVAMDRRRCMGRLYRYSMDTVGHERPHRACDPVWMRDFGRVYWVVRSRLVVWSPSRPEAERWPNARWRPDARDTSVHPEFTTRTMSAQFATQSIVRYVFVATPRMRCAHASGAGAIGAIGAGVRSRYRAVDREDTAASGRAFARGACVARASRGA